MDSSTRPAMYDTPKPKRRRRIWRVLGIGALIVLALAAGVAAGIGIERHRNDSTTTSTAKSKTTKPLTAGSVGANASVGPVAVSESGLSQLAATMGQPVYWAGPVPGNRYELTRTSAGSVYVRYLPKGVKAGAPGASYLIVATYPYPNAYLALKTVAKGNAVTIPGGGIALVASGYPQSVHFAFPRVAYQGEVYDPSAAKSLEVATSGTVQPVS